MGSITSTRHHIQNLTDHNIYVCYGKYDPIQTAKKQSEPIQIGTTSKSGESKQSMVLTIKNRPKGFNLIKPNFTDEHISDVGAKVSIIIVKKGESEGRLVISGQQLEVDRSYAIKEDGTFYKKKMSSNEFEKNTICWDFDFPVETYAWHSSVSSIDATRISN